MKETESNNKRVLIVTLHYLHGVGGGVFASRAFINTFAALYPGGVSVMCPGHPQHMPEGLDPSVRIISVDDRRPAWRKGLDLLRGRIHKYFKALPELLRKEKFDLVVFDNSRSSFRLLSVARESGAQVAVIHHNFEQEYVRDNSRGPLGRLSLFWTSCSEGRAWRESDLNFTLTPEDTKLLAGHYGVPRRPAAVLGTFESVERPLPELDGHDGAKQMRFIITGNLSAVQTERSLDSWLDDYFPVLESEFPGSKLVIAGKNPSEALVAGCNARGITVIPNPADMNPLLRDADCYICPTALGGGIKLRVMDGLRMGLPVITHTVSARGYSEFSRHGMLFEYSTPEEFRACCRRLRRERAERSDVRRLYSSVFSFAAGVGRLKEMLKEISL